MEIEGGPKSPEILGRNPEAEPSSLRSVLSVTYYSRNPRAILDEFEGGFTFTLWTDGSRNIITLTSFSKTGKVLDDESSYKILEQFENSQKIFKELKQQNPDMFATLSNDLRDEHVPAGPMGSILNHLLEQRVRAKLIRSSVRKYDSNLTALEKPKTI